MEREDGQSTRSEVAIPVTWFGCLSVKNALMVVNTMLLTCAALWTTLMALYIAQRSQSMQLDDLLISASSLALWSSAVGITFYGMCAIWSEKSGYVEAYFWIQLVHWILDLASTIVFLVFAYRKKDALAQTICSSDNNQQLCLNLFNGKLIMLTCGLCIYKALGVYAWYLLFIYRKALVANEKQDAPTLRWLRRASTSSISSMFEKRWWSPSQIPVIKIDFASDESSASVYSNDSAGYRNVNFGIPQFPTLAAPQQVLFASHIGGDALVPGVREAYPDVPSLPSYSVLGSERGVLR
jgi:hypothetical protein